MEIGKITKIKTLNLDQLKEHKMKWYTFSNLKESILEDLEKIKNHPLIPKNINIYGFIYDAKTGKLQPIEPAK